MNRFRCIAVVVGLGIVVGLLIAPSVLAGDAAPTSAPATQPASAPTSQPALVITRPAAVPVVSAKRIEALVGQLGDDSADARERAAKELEAVGLAAMGALRQAVKNDDLEIAAQAKALLRAIPKAAADGECLLWKVQLPEGDWEMVKDELTALVTGAQPRMRERTIADSWGIVVTKDLVIFHGGDGKIHALSRTTALPKWEYKTDSDMRSVRPTLILRGQTLLSETRHGGSPTTRSTTRLTALNVATGKRLWQNDDYIYYQVSEDHLVCTDDTYEWIHCLSIKDGKVLWKRDKTEFTDLRFLTPQWLTRDLVVCIASSNEPPASCLMALDLASGDKKWEAQGMMDWACVVVDGRLYTLSGNTVDTMTIGTIDLATGKELSDASIDVTSDSGGPSTAMQVTGTWLLHGGFDHIAACDLTTGKPAWIYALPKDSPTADTYRNSHWQSGSLFGAESVRDLAVAVHDGAVLLPTGNGLLAVDLATGKELWKYPMKNVIYYGVVARDGVAYFMDDHRVAEGAAGLMATCVAFWKVGRYKDDPPRYLYALDLAKAAMIGLPVEDD